VNGTRPDIQAGFTARGMRRLMFAEPGPCFVVAAKLVMEPDGREIEVPYMPDPQAASQGRTCLILDAPPGGGYMREAVLLAEDGAAIMHVGRGAPLWLPDGGTLFVSIEIT
jgi:hypothetical protein